MREWLSVAEIAALALPDVPGTVSGITRLAERDGWKMTLNQAGEPLARKRQGRGGGWEYHYSLLPSMAQAKLAKDAARAAQAAQATETAPKARDRELWSWFQKLPEARQAKANNRLKLLQAVEAMERGGMNKNIAVNIVAREFKVGASTLYGWFDLVAGLDKADWLPALAPRHAGRTTTEECDPLAWEFLKADWLRLSGPSLETCMDRLDAAAKEQGWKIPSRSTLRRRIETEIPVPVRVLTREGVEALNELYPWQERDRTMFHALEAINMDGHKWDVFVRWLDGTVSRPMMVAIQDLYSNKILGWRVDKSENADTVRLALGDVFRNFGIPDLAWMDNGRGFASKWITGGAPTRFRFKVKPEDPVGILTALGVQAQFTKPYSGRSKPIERAFRDLCDAVAKHPAFEGAYTGNKPDAKPENYGERAVPIDDFLKVVAQGIRMHNAKPKRNTRVCGRVKSFDEAFEESYRAALIRRANEEQLRMFLLAAEAVKADSENGSVRLLGNRYWSESLIALRGHPVVVRFDPDNLHGGVHVYRMDGVHVGFAECWETVGFADTQAARDSARKRNAFVKATKATAELEKGLSLDQLAALMPEVEEEETPAPSLIAPVFGNLAAVASVLPAGRPEEEADASAAFFERFGAGLQLLQGGRND